ncbi:hypothetical protein SH1V18_39260 [Vallitalea longa]|uniref:alpha-L-rhamnosidase n=1 Tax=Vallitalea longa TaxID=2936439 RepID=A0A9W5YEZ0_9FIRM|nr:family 78 glycoside hydrolase catalytic domain [Vallitalea longa]GKX31446.1 hypothetical protein SH1V18_39260 [Vallitalea longa]
MKKHWNAKWIIDPSFKGLKPIDIFRKEMQCKNIEEHRDNLKNKHMLIRKKFRVCNKEKNAVINITADDYYKLYINGQFVGQGPAPGYYFAYKYNCYDISKYLVEGENVIAVHVYYQGLRNRVWNSGDYRQGMIAEVYMDHNIILSTDETWKYQISEAFKSGGTTGYETQYLENFDSRLYDEDWITTAYNDSKWSQVSVNEDIDYSFEKDSTVPLEVYERKAVEVNRYYENSYLIDFGQEITGQFLMTAQGNAGQVIEIRYGEELDELDETHVRYHMRCNCDYQEFWTLSGAVDHLNIYDYKAFRYVEVIVPKGCTVKSDFTAIVRHYPFEDKGFIYQSSNKMIDHIIKICKNGVKYGTQEVYVDCPTREKGQYLGDFTVTGHSHIYLTGKTDMYKQTLIDFANSTFICHGIMAVAPGARMQEIADFSMQWPMQLHQYYRQSGDKSFLNEMYKKLVDLEEYFKSYERKDGLLVKVDEKWNLVDWPNNLRDNYDCELSKPMGDECHNVINAHYYGMLTYIEKIRSILHIEPINDLDSYKKSFVKAFYNEELQLFVDKENSTHSAMHSNALPLLFDLFPTNNIENAVKLIKNRIHHCGVQMSYFVLKALAKVGEYEAVYTFIKELWSTMVKEGATTCYEAWGKNQKFNTSLCHPWASAPIPILVEEVIGLNPEEPGWSKIRFAPHIPESLETFKLEVKVKCGRINIKKENGILTIEAPHGVEIIH